MLHVLTSLVFAVLMQTPGVHMSALDAAISVEQAAVAHPAGGAGRACPCRHTRAH